MLLPVAWRSKGRKRTELNPVTLEKFRIRGDFLTSHLARRVFIRPMIHIDSAAIRDPNNPRDLFPYPRGIPRIMK